VSLAWKVMMSAQQQAPSTEVYILGEYFVRPGFEERVRASLVEHEARTRAEPGCLDATVHQDLDDPRRLFSLQRWASEEALEAHRALPHVRAMDGRASEVLARPFTLTVLRPR
jgi:quinol monooxygenase YgiN